MRWDKNFLGLLYTTLSRRDKFRAYGGVRLGGTVTIEDAWKLGFAHMRDRRRRRQADHHRAREQPHPRRAQGSPTS